MSLGVRDGGGGGLFGSPTLGADNKSGSRARVVFSVRAVIRAALCGHSLLPHGNVNVEQQRQRCRFCQVNVLCQGSDFWECIHKMFTCFKAVTHTLVLG